MTNKLLCLVCLLSLFLSCNKEEEIVLLPEEMQIEQTTYVPDNNFEQALIDLGYDDVLDDSVITENIKVVNQLNLAYKNIKDLTGIQDFETLSSLNLYYNQLTNLDISSNINLKVLNCSFNLMDSIDVSDLGVLEELAVEGNDLNELDVSANAELRSLELSLNDLTEIDLSNNIKLEVLSSGGNQFSNLDLTNNINLKELGIGGAHHNLTELDISNCTELTNLTVSYIDIVILDISQNQKLQRLNVNFLDSLEKICVWELPFPDTIEVVSHMNSLPFEICTNSI